MGLHLEVGLDAITTKRAPELRAPGFTGEEQAALQSPNVAATLQYRVSHFAAGYSQRADDAISYGQMLNNAHRLFWQPMIERTNRTRTPSTLRAAATAAAKCAAMLLAFADKATREAEKLEADERAKD